MMDLLVIGGVVAAALLVIASGVWVALELIAEIAQSDTPVKGRGNSRTSGRVK